MEKRINDKSGLPRPLQESARWHRLMGVGLLLAAGVLASGSRVGSAAPLNRNKPPTQPANAGGQGMGRQTGNSQSHLLPVPPRLEQAAARQALEAEFNRLYLGRVNPFTVRQFLPRLAAAAEIPKNHPVRCYVALDMAIRLSGTFDSFTNGQNAIRQLVANYNVKKEESEAKFVHLWANSRFLAYNNVAAHLQQVETWASQAVQASDLTTARQIATDGLRLAIRFEQRNLTAQFRMVLMRIKAQRPMLKKYLAAEKRLLAHPNDPQANQTVGLYKIVTQDYVSAGAKYLVLAADPTWREIGKLGVMDFNIQPPMPPAPQLREAKLWWTVASREKANAYYATEMRRMGRWCFDCAAHLVNRGFILLLFKGHYHKALHMLDEAIALAAHAKKPRNATAHLAAWKQMLADIKKLRTDFLTAMAAVSAGSATPKTNESIGVYLCFGEGRWKEGLVYLVHAKTSAVRDAARRDVALPVQSAAQLAAGDAWWRLARNATGLEKLNLESRAAYWFKQALPKLKGRDRKRVQYHLLHFRTLMKAE